MRVKCEIEEVVLQNDNGNDVDSIQARCSECDHTTESYGTTERSIKRCLVLMKEECPHDCNNFYVTDDD